MALLGVPIRISVDTLVLAVVIWVIGARYIKGRMQTASSFKVTSFAFLSLVAILVSLFVHEFGHAFVAMSQGYLVVDVSTFIYGASVAYLKVAENPVSNLLVSLAGPMTSLAIALACIVPVKAMGESLLENTIEFVAIANWSLFWINMLPIMVLDGGQALQAAIEIVFGYADFAYGISLFISGVTVLLVLWTRGRVLRPFMSALSTIQKM